MVYINSYVLMNSSMAILNGQSVSLSSADMGSSFLVRLYHHLGVDYAKFFKMDTLCRGGFLASELLLGAPQVSPIVDGAILSFSSTSSLHTDIHYQSTISNLDNYYPSPSIFVYTLANIISGEIAIRHKWLGETSTYILPQFDAQRMLDIAEMMWQRSPRVNQVLLCWTDSLEDHLDISIYRLSRCSQQLAIEASAENLNQLRNQIFTF